MVLLIVGWLNRSEEGEEHAAELGRDASGDTGLEAEDVARPGENDDGIFKCDRAGCGRGRG